MESCSDAESRKPLAPRKSAPMKKKLCCRYCKRKFSSHQALGGHQNAHKTERAATQREKILSMASPCGKDSYVGGFVDSSKCYGFKGKTIGLKDDPWKGQYTWHYVQNTIHRLESLNAEGNEFHQHQKPYQTLIFPILTGGAPNSESQSQALFSPNICDKVSFWQERNSSMISQNAIIQMPDLNVKISFDDENFGEENTFSPMAANGVVEELDLTLKL